MNTLATKYQCNVCTIQNVLKHYGIKRRTLSEARRNYLNYEIDENSFDKIDTREKAYWLGVMYSDGYISKKDYTNSFGLTVSTKDYEWLEKFKKFLKYSGEIKNYNTSGSSFVVGKPYSRLIIGNNKIVSDLEKFGVIEHKTKKISNLPNIENQLLDDFIRGYIDGDGSLRAKYPDLRICGNKDFFN